MTSPEIEHLHRATLRILDEIGVRLEHDESYRDFAGLRVIAENCRKHARVLCFTPRGAEALVEMKRCFDGPWFSIGFTAPGPLRWTHLALDIFAKTAGYGIPATILNRLPRSICRGPLHEAARQRAEEIIARDRDDKIASDALTKLRRIENRFRLT